MRSSDVSTGQGSWWKGNPNGQITIHNFPSPGFLAIARRRGRMVAVMKMVGRMIVMLVSVVVAMTMTTQTG